MIKNFDFDDCQRMSHGVAPTTVRSLLMSQIPAAQSAIPATADDDRNGTDWWVLCRDGHWLSVDVKVRSEDHRVLRKLDDLALEIWSDRERRVVGWTGQLDKRTDYILWFWKDTKRFCMVPFPMLNNVFRKYGRYWGTQYPHGHQKSSKDGRCWFSECVFVPRREVWTAIIQNANNYWQSDES